ncbi:hypothetical protein [Mycobacterium sp.]|uniref:hypothetical protein n=1 Tax=Mycobacterium sp. TaxID=1785 RepID=UPI002C898B52|nr:hypothetical protein [Mycobacterium sp.]HTQ15827.1 hypothetical protein [Mycobacterium sp.]
MTTREAGKAVLVEWVAEGDFVRHQYVMHAGNSARQSMVIGFPIVPVRGCRVG